MGLAALNRLHTFCNLFRVLVLYVIGLSLFFATEAKSHELITLTPAKQTQQIDSLIHHTLPNASIGIVIREAKTGKTLYARNAQELFPPASVLKLFTAAASLLSLGPDYRFATTVQVNKHDLTQPAVHNVYIRFSGDPSFTTEGLRQLISQVKNLGIQHISGNIVIDDTLFQAPHYAMGWSWESLAWYYAAPVSSIILDENQLPIHLKAHKLGEKVEVTCNVKTCEAVGLKTEVISVSKQEAETSCQIQVDMDQQNVLNLTGCWPYSATPITLKVALKNPYALAEKLILAALKIEDIQLGGKIMRGATPQGVETVAVHYSEPLNALLKNVLQNSNNIYADSLTKTLGVKQFQQGTFQAGTRAIKEILSKPTGIDFEALRLLDGSGASRYNLMTPQQIAHLLLNFYRDEKNRGPFQEALAVSGDEKSTLFGRMNFFDMQGRILAKTGSLLNISTLAGYLKTKSNRDLVFVIMMDHVVEDPAKIKAFEDELCRLFVSVY